MTTSLPSTPLTEPALGSVAAGTAAPTLLDLFSAALGGATPEGAPMTGATPAPGADFASLLAPANPAPTHAAPAASMPAPALALATNVVAAPAGTTSGRAQRLETTVNAETAAASASTIHVEHAEAPTAASLDRSTLEAALALLATVMPPPPPPPTQLSQSQIADASERENASLAPTEANLGEAPALACAMPPHLRVTLTTPAGTHAVTAAPTGETLPASAPVTAPVAPAISEAPSSLTAKPSFAAPLPDAETTPLRPVHAELEWESGMKLAADLAPAKPAPLTAAAPAVAEGAKTPAAALAANVASSAVPSPRRAVPSPQQTEKNAASIPSATRTATGENSSAEKNFLTLAPSEVTAASPKAGIAVAQMPPAMPAASHHSPNAVASALPVASSAAMPRAEAPAAPALEQTAQRAVDTVLEIVHAQVVSKLQPVPSVQLRFKVGHEDLAVRVQLRDGEVRAEFRTDNAELRAAVAQEWRAVTAKPEAALRFLEPVITAANPTAGQGGATGQGGSAFQQQQQQQQAQQQQFRTQMELFGSVRRAFPAAAVPAELSPVTPLVAAAASHRLSAVA